jgi:hypothetical protein
MFSLGRGLRCSESGRAGKPALVSVPRYHIAAVAEFADRRTPVLEQFTPQRGRDERTSPKVDEAFGGVARAVHPPPTVNTCPVV